MKSIVLSILVVLVLLAASAQALADHNMHYHRRRHLSHASNASVMPNELKRDVSHVEKRAHSRRDFPNSRATWYDVGLGACGITNNPGDFIVALTVQQFGAGYPGPNCFKDITISYGGLTAVAMITDECMGCPYGGIDMSKGLFEYFVGAGNAFQIGVITVDWWFNSDAPVTPNPPVQPTSSSQDTHDISVDIIYPPSVIYSSSSIPPPSPSTSSTAIAPTTSVSASTSSTSVSSSTSTSSSSSTSTSDSTLSDSSVSGSSITSSESSSNSDPNFGGSSGGYDHGAPSSVLYEIQLTLFKMGCGAAYAVGGHAK